MVFAVHRFQKRPRARNRSYSYSNCTLIYLVGMTIIATIKGRSSTWGTLQATDGVTLWVNMSCLAYRSQHYMRFPYNFMKAWFNKESCCAFSLRSQRRCPTLHRGQLKKFVISLTFTFLLDFFAGDCQHCGAGGGSLYERAAACRCLLSSNRCCTVYENSVKHSWGRRNVDRHSVYQ